MARKLDKSRPYGTIHHGEVSDGSAYEQDGCVFDAQGHEWTAPASASPPASSFSGVVEDVEARIAAAVAAALKAAGVGSKPEADKPEAKAKAVDKNLQG